MNERKATKRTVAVLGGGMTGLSAAFYLYREAERRGVPLAVTVLEASSRLGGRVNTLRRDGFVIERGPESFLARKLPMIELAEALGMTGEFTGTNPAAKVTYIAHDNVLHGMPAGLNLGVPTNAEAFLATGLLSEEGKRRALAEVDVPPAVIEEPDSQDESVGDFLERRFGAEMVTRIFEPLLAGIYAGDLYGLGLAATFPQFRELERQYGSVIRGLAEQSRAARERAVQGQTVQVRSVQGRGGQESPAQGAAQEKPTPRREDREPSGEAAGSEPTAGGRATPSSEASASRSIGSLFLTFSSGLQSVIEALEARLREEGCEIRLGMRVTALRKMEAGSASASASASGPSGTYRLAMDDGSWLDADAVVVALPAAGIADLLEPHADVSAMRNTRYVSVANVVFGYDEDGFDHPLDGSGFLVPRGEGRLITASTWTSSKWLHTAPAGKRLIRCYVGRAGEETNVELSDEAMTAGVRRDLQELMGLTAVPSFVEITRHRRAMPQYPPGHRTAVEAFLAELAGRLPGVMPAGQPFGGVGLPDCVEQGRQAAESVVRTLGARYNRE